MNHEVTGSSDYMALGLTIRCRKVIDSCETVGQYLNAMRYLKLAEPHISKCEEGRQLIQNFKRRINETNSNG